ncbi:MAG: hypothetical protein LAP61_29195 [Acidobacteriia bacterium]|nr:hypothetical protein [Terriglobia bacterium]
MRFLQTLLRPLVFFLAPMFAFAGQSLRLNGSQTASNNSVAAQPANAPCRVEFQLTYAANPADGNPAHVNACDIYIQFGANNLVIYFARSASGWSCCFNIPLSSFPSNWINVRVQQIPSGSGGSLTWEAWAIDGTKPISHMQTYSSTSGSNSSGATVGSTGNQNSSWGYFRVYTTTLPLGSTEPTFSDNGNLLEWKFNRSLVDSSGRAYTANSSGGTPASSCGSTPCYEDSSGQNLVTAVIKTNPAPAWGNWQSWRAGTSVGLDGSASVSMGDSSGIPSLEWQILSGPSVPVWSSHTSVRPTLTGIVFGNYRVQLVATNSNGGSATSIADIGAVAYDDNGVVIPADPKVTEIFGPQIAFGQNKWGYEDKQNLVAVNEQTTYWLSIFDTTWTTTNASGTISYPFYAKGFSPGAACTTLNGAITASATTIVVNNSSCLSLSGLPGEPTWILVGTSPFGAWELIRICSVSGNTLTVCYDGRGVSGNNWPAGVGGVTNVGGASTWGNGALVGEMRVQGTSTLFATDARRPICPAGVPGPPGPVLYSAGTVTLSESSTTVAGSGTTWTSAMVGGFIRVAATHASGASFVFWAQISGFTDATHLVMNRPAPTGVDASAFSYKITSPLYLDMEFNGPNLDPASQGATHIARTYFNGVGCESETAMFALPFHDIGALNTTTQSGVHYSYTFNPNDIYVPNSSFTPYYGVGLMARNFYYRSGYGPALTLANVVDEFAVRDPSMSDGYAGGQPLETGGFVVGAMADLALNGSTALNWYNVEQYATSGNFPSAACNATDTRDGGYLEAFLALAALFDTNAANKAAFQNFLGLSTPSMLSRDNGCKRNAPDSYSGAEVNSFANSFVYNPQGTGTERPLTLTNGSTTVTGTGFTNNYSSAGGPYCYGIDIIRLTVHNGSSVATVASGTLSHQNINDPTTPIMIYFYDGSNTWVLQYLGEGGTGTSVQLAAVYTGTSGTFRAMSTGGGPITSGGQYEGGYAGIFADTLTNGHPTYPTADWPSITQAMAFANNRMLEEVWACKYVSPTQLTLFRSWDGPSTSGLTAGLNYYISYYNVSSFGQSPFFYGIKTNAIRWASLNSNATIASTASTMLPLLGEWFNSYGWDANNPTGLGTMYWAVPSFCAPRTPAGSFDSQAGFQGCGSDGLTTNGIVTARVNSVEAGSAMIQYYLDQCTKSPLACDTARARVDTFYGAIFGYQPYCDPSITSTCGTLIASNYTDTDLSQYKWPGFFFGMGGLFANSWPAVRLGGSVPELPRTLNVTCNISSVINAAKCRVILTKPDGSTITNTCTVSPCSVTADAREGDHLLKVDYLSASDAVLAAGESEPVKVK